MSLSRKQDEYHLKILRELLRQPGNKQCFDCPQRAPIYANMLNNTFVCEACAGLHRELNHRIKSISASRFTPQEIAALRNGGNEKAAKIWAAKWDEKKDRVPDISDVIEMRKYMRKKYVERRWMSDEHQHLYEPDPLARFLPNPPSTTVKKAASSNSLELASSPVRRITSQRSDFSIGQTSSYSSSSYSDTTNDDEAATRRSSTPNESSLGSRRTSGSLNVTNSRSVTIYDRYQNYTRDSDQRRGIAYEPTSAYDDDTSSVATSSATSTSGSRQASAMRHYLRHVNLPSSEGSTVGSEGDNAARYARYRELAQQHSYCDGNESIDEFFEMMRERVSGSGRRDSSESTPSSLHSTKNPFVKRAESVDASDSPRSSTPYTPSSNTQDGVLIQLDEASASNSTSDLASIQAPSAKHAYSSVSTHYSASPLARMQPQRSMSMPIVPYTMSNRTEYGAHTLYHDNTATTSSPLRAHTFTATSLTGSSQGHENSYATPTSTTTVHPSIVQHPNMLMQMSGSTTSDAAWQPTSMPADQQVSKNPFGVVTTPMSVHTETKTSFMSYQSQPQQTGSMLGAQTNNPFIFDNMRNALTEQSSSMLTSGPNISGAHTLPRSQTAPFLSQQW